MLLQNARFARAKRTNGFKNVLFVFTHNGYRKKFLKNTIFIMNYGPYDGSRSGIEVVLSEAETSIRHVARNLIKFKMLKFNLTKSLKLTFTIV